MTGSGRPRGTATREADTAYGRVAAELRRELGEGRYPRGRALPTEAELVERFSVSRQTVRRAFQDLVAEGLVHRIPGRGTFASEDGGKYLRSSGSIDELMALSLDTELDVVEPPHVGVDIDAAGRLQLDTDEVVTVRFRRLHQSRPYCVASAYLPVPVGAPLLELDELARPGVRHATTLLSVVQRISGRRIAGADQSITAEPATERVAAEIECPVGSPVLRIDRLYFDHDRQLMELAVNHFNPARYTYRFRMRAHPS
jgi:DNA-binding GntR family transcriptional regulator